MKSSVRLSDGLKAAQHAAVLVLLPVLFLALATVGAHASVGLAGFSGTPGDGRIVINWETATEFDNAGFFIHRGNQLAGPFTRISGFIPAEGDSVTGGSYSFTDEQVTNGVAYYYILEDISYSQASSTHGPITVTAGLATATPTSPPPVGAPPTSTSMPTRASALTPTPTPTRTTPPPEAKGGPAPAPLPSGMTPLATATATTAVLTASRVTVTSASSGVFASPQATSLPATFAASSSNPVSGGASPTHAAVQPTQASTAISELKPTLTPVSIAGQGTPSDTFPGAIKSTDWAVVGLAFGLFAASLILILGAILVVRLLLSR